MNLKFKHPQEKGDATLTLTLRLGDSIILPVKGGVVDLDKVPKEHEREVLTKLSAEGFAETVNDVKEAKAEKAKAKTDDTEA